MLQELDEFCEKMIEQVDTLSLDNELLQPFVIPFLWFKFLCK